MLRRCGAGKVVGIRLPSDLVNLDALVFPGGESTTMSKLLTELDLLKPITSLAKAGLPMFGTCAGCILLAKNIKQRPEQPRIGCMDITVNRNAYGSQIDSFEALVESEYSAFDKGGVLRAVLIRAPAIEKTGGSVKVLARHKGRPVLVRENNFLACTFHPEITDDTRVHTLFLEMVRNQKHGL